MKIVKTNYRLLLLLSSIFLIDGCSTKESVAVSQVHVYNNNYGMLPNNKVDEIISSEIESQDEPTEIDYSSLNPEYTTELKRDPDAFLAEEWVQPAPKISYKYMDDPNFYSEDELPENKFRTGNVIVKTQRNTDESVLYSRK